jgi:hypothetical protein
LDFPNRFIYSTDLTAAGVYQGSAAELVFDRVTITGGIGTNTELAVFDYDYWDGYLWGVSRLGNLSKLNLDGTRTDFDIGLPESFNQFGGYGGVWVDDTMPGSLFAYINKVDASNGAVYRIDGISSLSTSATDFSIGDSWSAPNINWNDGTYIIPEPATLCLLGLGSLGFLRRRKRT